MSIGSTIKKLRRERDMTQEQLAEYLGITANAVSQWECDRTMPDISQLPILANLFRVSADVILGINIGSIDKEVEEIHTRVRELSCTGHREEANKICREGLCKYPDAYILMEELAFNLSYSNDSDVQKESIELFEQIIAGNGSDNSKNFAMGNLVSLYMSQGNTEKAKQLAESIPDPIFTSRECLLMTLRGAEWADEMRCLILSSFDIFIWRLHKLTNAFNDTHPLFTDEELITLCQKIIKFVELFYENGDYAFDEQLIINAHFCCAKLYIKLGDTETALSELEQMAEHIEIYDQYSDGLRGHHVILPTDKWPTSLLVRPRDENDGRLVMQVSSPSTENAAMEYLRSLSDGIFYSIRSDAHFCELIDRLKKTARE